MVITFSDVLTVLRKIVDISLVWFIFFYILKNIKNNVKLSLIFDAILDISLLIALDLNLATDIAFCCWNILTADISSKFNFSIPSVLS